MIAAGGGVVKQFCRTANGRNHNVNLSVVVKIAERAPAVGSTNLHARTSIIAHVLKSSIMHVAKHGIGLPVVLLTI